MCASQPRWRPKKRHRRAEDGAFSVFKKERRKEDRIKELKHQEKPLGAMEGAPQEPGKRLHRGLGRGPKGGPRKLRKETQMGRGPEKSLGGPGKGKRERKTQSNNGSHKEGHRGPRNKPQRGPRGGGMKGPK
jgi:hypothetical protein